MNCTFLENIGPHSCGMKQSKIKRPGQFLETSFQLLSEEEKDCVHRDLYGIAEPIEETPEFIDRKLEDLVKELNLLSRTTKSAYRIATQRVHEQALSSKSRVDVAEDQEYEGYITSRKFRLMFLRAERFDTRMAAKRLEKHFKEKLELFGEESVARRIEQSDLNAQDMEALRSGALVVPGTTDDGGRLIVVSRARRMLPLELINIKRMAFYLITRVLESDEESQKKGIVVIVYNVGPKHKLSQQHKVRATIFPWLRFVSRALPLRAAGLHFCYNDFRYHILINIVLVVLPRDARARFQCHYGQQDECRLQLLPYGINVDDWNLTEDGEFPSELILQYLEKLILEEDAR